MPKKTDEEKKLEAIQKLKTKVAKQVNETMSKALKNLTKDLNNILKSNNLWYCDGELIKDNEEMQTDKDRNADQMIIDHFITINDEMFKHVENRMLWTKDDFSK